MDLDFIVFIFWIGFGIGLRFKILDRIRILRNVNPLNSGTFQICGGADTEFEYIFGYEYSDLV